MVVVALNDDRSAYIVGGACLSAPLDFATANIRPPPVGLRLATSEGLVNSDRLFV